MQFSVEVDGKALWKRIIEGEVTATGRQWKPYYQESVRSTDNEIDTIRGKNGAYLGERIPRLYYVGQSLVLQPGRTKPGVWWREVPIYSYSCFEYSDDEDIKAQYELDCITTGKVQFNIWLYSLGFKKARITIKSLRKLDVREMTDEEARRTGFATSGEYLAWWAGQYIKSHEKWNLADWAYHKQHPELWLEDGMYQFAMLYIGFKFEEAT